MIQHDDTPMLETFDAFFRRAHRAILGLAFVLSGA